MRGAAGATIEITDVQKRAGDLWVHFGRVTGGSLSVGEAVDLEVEAVRRTRIRANHSATHLLHKALRGRLGDHVTQKGSLVADDRLRFDFAQPLALTRDDVVAVENRGQCPDPRE